MHRVTILRINQDQIFDDETDRKCCVKFLNSKSIFVEFYYIELFKICIILTLFRMGIFGAAHGWGRGGQKGPLSLKSVTDIL